MEPEIEEELKLWQNASLRDQDKFNQAIEADQKARRKRIGRILIIIGIICAIEGLYLIFFT